MATSTHTIVLGAGIVGVSIAWHLAKRGLDVVLIDRREPGEEASYGNAALIERSSIMPYMFPRGIGELLRYAANRETAAHYHLTFLPKIAPWLFAYWRNSSPARSLAIARANLGLVEACVTEHQAMAREAGVEAMLRAVGWIKLFDDERGLEAGAKDARALAEYGIRFDVLDRPGLLAREPHLSDLKAGGVHFLDPIAVRDPGALTKAYAKHAGSLGVRFLHGDALTLRDEGGRWRVQTSEGEIEAHNAVVALGSWSNLIVDRLGYRIPLAVKRGYHRHYRPLGNAVLDRPVVDAAAGFVIVPTSQGLRVTTGAEFADRDAPPTPVQSERVEPLARALFPLGEAVEAKPWMGARPCLPDMTPVIGPAPHHAGLWFAFGHAHHGLTNGPATGRLIAELIAGTTPFIDPKPFSATRFG